MTIAILSYFMALLAQPITNYCQTPSSAKHEQQVGTIMASANDWLLWGGPQRDFIAPVTGLASSWPAEGPCKLWSRALGDGYSGIAVEGTTLYTVYRRGSQDIVTAIDASRGTTVWEYAYEAEFKNSFSEKVGPGPYAMLQVVGDRLVTASGIGRVQSLDNKTGHPVWSRVRYI